MTLCPYVKTHDRTPLRRDVPSLNAITTVVFLQIVPLFLFPTQGVFSGFAFVWFHQYYIYLSFPGDAMYLMYESICNNISFVSM